MKYLILLFFTISTAMACQVSIPESYVPTFLNPPVSGFYMKCEEKPDEACYCVDSVDPWTSELVEGERGKVFAVNPDRLAAYLKSQNDKKAADDAKKEKKKNFSFKGSTIAQLKAELNEWLDLNK